MQGIVGKTAIRICLGVVAGVLASAVFLVVAFRFWDSIITPYPLHVTQTRKTVILFVEIGIYSATGLVFGIVNSLFVPREWHDSQIIVGASLAFIVTLPFILIEGHFVPALLIIPLLIAAACVFFIRLGQLIISGTQTPRKS
jgi:hypothetical protein